MPLVLDTNVLVSWIVGGRKDSAVARVVKHALRHERLLFSGETLEELERVLNRRKFDRYVPQEKRRAFFLMVVEVSLLVPVTEQTTACRDAKDNKFLDVAVAGGADYLITGDGDLLALHPFDGVSIVTAAAFLANHRPTS